MVMVRMGLFVAVVQELKRINQYCIVVNLK